MFIYRTGGLFLLLLYLQLSYFLMTIAFNVDTNHFIVYNGKPGTFFGYSVAMVKNNDPNETPRILIGAPKDTYNFTKFNKTGVLYKCRPTPDSCVSSRVHSLGQTLKDYTVQRVNNAWIGGDISVNPTNTKILTCAYRWKEWSKTDQGTISLTMPGICYMGDLETDRYQLVRSKSSSVMGKDATFSKDGTKIIIGVPGYNDLAGGALTFKSDDLTSEKIYNATLKSNSYVGYSVASGTFFSDKLEYYVLGAPRYNNTGAVYIMSQENSIRQEITHTDKLGAYFGATLCVSDINNDGFDDLLIGIPLYTKNNLEEGAVILYLSDGQQLVYNQSIYGMEKERGQFGTAIKDVGDINGDGFNDIVIGAPYENNQEGAIYVYNLGPEGFPANFSQRISGKDVGRSREVKGFGISLSRAIDVNDDSCPDFLVGSYLSSQVHLLKSRPVISLDIKAKTTPERIDVNRYNCPPPNSKSVCLDLQITLSYKSALSYLPNELELDCKLHTEVSSRANNASSNVHRALIKYDLTTYDDYQKFPLKLSATKTAKLNFNLLVKDKTDIFSPIAVFLDYKIHEGSLKNCPNLCPVLKGSQYIKLINYNLDCGSDEQCTSDLQLSMTSDVRHIEYGKKRSFLLYVTIDNKGETAYNTLALFTFPSYVQYVQVKDSDVSECSLDTSENEELLRCSLGNQIKKNSKVTFTLHFTTQGSLDEHEININASVTTKSDEKNLDNNQAVIRIPIKMKSEITFNGYSEPNLLHLSKEKSLLHHNFEIYNNGPSPLLDARISITAPEMREFVAIDCSESTLNCTTEFNLENLNYGERKLIKVVLIVDPNIFTKAKDIKFLRSRAVLTRKPNSLYVDDKLNWHLTAEITTNLQTETKPISYWIVIISIIAGLLVLAIMILILWKIGFFKRKKAGDCDALTEEKENEQQEEKTTLQEPNGNNSSLPIKDKEKMALSSEEVNFEEVNV